MPSPADAAGVIKLPIEHFLIVHVQDDGGDSISVSIPLVVDEKGFPQIKGKRQLEKEKGLSGLFTRITLEMKSPELCVGCGAPLSRVPDELRFEVQVRTLVFEEGKQPGLGEEVVACQNCVRDALKDPEVGLGGMPILFEAKGDITKMRPVEQVPRGSGPK